MPEPAITPRLPAELLLSVFDHLRPRDLAQVCKANSYLRQLARPFFYRFATMTKFGLHFPGARRQHPFLDVPGTLRRFSDRKLRRLASRIKDVYIPAHAASDCAAFCNLQLKEVKCRASTLRIEGGVRVLENSDFRDRRGTFPHTDHLAATARDEDGGVEPCECSYDCAYHDNEHLCYFIRAIASTMRFEKVVIRSAPLGEDEYVDPSEREAVKVSKEFVTVLDSRDIWKDSGRDYMCKNVGAALNPFWEAKVITVVLWTGQPDVPWLPPCDDHLAGPNFAEVVSGPNDEALRRQCFIMDDLWADIGAKLVSMRSRNACRTLRIVNATAVLETFVDPGDGRIEKRRTSTTAIEDSIRDHAKTHHLHPKVKNWKGEIIFLSMEEWITLGEWEDVFSRQEMEPFLTRDLTHVIDPPAET